MKQVFQLFHSQSGRKYIYKYTERSLLPIHINSKFTDIVLM